MTDVSLPIAFLAGIVSFLSPCVLPLVPGYISYMSGISASAPDTARAPSRAGAAAAVFVLGFTVVFVPLGATATLLGSLLNDYQDQLRIAGGVFIIFLGLVFLGVFRFGPLARDTRFQPRPAAGLWGSAVLGGAFAFGWSPCIGPVLGSVLTMAAGNGSAGGAGEGALLLGAYSLGLGVPFVAAGLGITRLGRVVGWLRRHTRTVSLVSGTAMVVVGVLFVTNQLFQISIWMQRTFVALNLDFLANI
ncbi:MAG TPA: cytochrome c biogenesis protein CcdA [Actinomycetota bacterium]|nr:cytochrome c biogenesis protein CcdA [Actinomycetota bacterium]